MVRVWVRVRFTVGVMAEDSSTLRYGKPQFLLKSTVRWYSMPFLQWGGFGTLVRYAFFVKVQVRFVGTLFELKLPDFSQNAPAFCTQRQEAAETETVAKCMI